MRREMRRREKIEKREGRKRAGRKKRETLHILWVLDHGDRRIQLPLAFRITQIR